MGRWYSHVEDSYSLSPTCPIMRNRHFARFPLHLSGDFRFLPCQWSYHCRGLCGFCASLDAKKGVVLLRGFECWIQRGATSPYPNVYRIRASNAVSASLLLKPWIAPVLPRFIRRSSQAESCTLASEHCHKHDGMFYRPNTMLCKLLHISPSENFLYRYYQQSTI